jgi:hypothetical protein
MQIVVSCYRGKTSLTKYLDSMESNEGRAIRLVLNNHEFICLGIRKKAFDEKLYKFMECSNFLKIWEAAAEIIQEIRVRENKYTYFQEFEWLAKKWKKQPLKQINK